VNEFCLKRPKMTEVICSVSASPRSATGVSKMTEAWNRLNDFDQKLLGQILMLRVRTKFYSKAKLLWIFLIDIDLEYYFQDM
jgi:hypothetical protein